MEKNENYSDFSNRSSFNNQPCRNDEELVPAVLTSEMKKTLTPAGLDLSNVETWTFQHGKKVPVVFIPNKKGLKEAYMKLFNSEVERYLKHTDDQLSGDLSLDEFLDNINDEDAEGFDPTGTTENEDAAFLNMVFGMLLEDLNEQDPNMAKIIKLLADGFQKKEILEQVDLGKGKSQGYAFIEKTQKIAREIYFSKYGN